MRKRIPENHIVGFFYECICKLWWKISIWSITKVNLNTLLYILCWQWQRSNVFTRFSHTVAGILAHPSMQISSRTVMFWGCCWATWVFQLPPKIFYGVEIWRLARPLQDLEMLLTKPLLRCPGGVFGIIVMLKRTSHVSSSMPLLMVGRLCYFGPSSLHVIH